MLPGFVTEPVGRSSPFASTPVGARTRTDAVVPQQDDIILGEGGRGGPLRSHPQTIQCPGCAIIRCGFLGLQSCLTCC